MGKLKVLWLFLLMFIVFFVNGQQHTGNNSSGTEFKIATWNIEWLGCSTYGPVDETLQLSNAAKVVKALNADVIALQEIGTSSSNAIVDSLVNKLGNEWGGYILPASPDLCGQNEAILYKKARVQLLSTSMITDGGSSYDWSGGRYPVLYNINLVDGTTLTPVSFINIHAKAMGDETSYNRRKNASASLKSLLDGPKYNTKKVILLGDFNDYLIGTQCNGCTPDESPYKNFMEDTLNYRCLTTSLYDPIFSSPVIDNIIISDELKANYIAGSTIRDVASTQTVTSFLSTTSDHTPVSARFSFSATTPPECDNISFSETFSTSLGDFSAYSVSGSQTWRWQAVYGATISGYAGGLNNINEDWLISPAFDLSDKKTATLAFSHAINYSAVETDKLNNHTLWITDSYTEGLPSEVSWSKLSIPVMPAGNSWSFVSSGNIEVPAVMLKKNVRFGFKYLSAETTAGTWEIKELTFSTTCSTAQIPGEPVLPENIIYASTGKIHITSQKPADVDVYDITGRLLYRSQQITGAAIAVGQPGIYLVKTNSAIQKIIVP